MIFKKNELLEKNRWSKIDFLIKFPDDSAWFCMEKLNKHSFETNKNKDFAKHKPKNNQQIYENIGFPRVPWCCLISSLNSMAILNKPI